MTIEHGPWLHNSIVRLAIVGQALGQAVVNVFHFEMAAAAEPAGGNDEAMQDAVFDLLTHFANNIMTPWRAFHPGDYSVIGLTGQCLERPNLRNHKLVPIDYTTGFPQSGTFLSDGVSPGVTDDVTTAAVVKWKSVLAGKSHRGRCYVGPFDQVQTDRGKLVSATISLIQTWVSTMFSAYQQDLGGYPAVRQTVYSRPYDEGKYQYTTRDSTGIVVHTPPAYSGNSTFILSGSVDPILRTQRRRELGVGS